MCVCVSMKWHATVPCWHIFPHALNADPLQSGPWGAGKADSAALSGDGPHAIPASARGGEHAIGQLALSASQELGSFAPFCGLFCSFIFYVCESCFDPSRFKDVQVLVHGLKQRTKGRHLLWIIKKKTFYGSQMCCLKKKKNTKTQGI